MSRPGDVVWSGGRAWQRGRYGSAVDVKAWWVNPAVGTATLHTLRMADDFRWLVKDGKRVVHADDCPPQVRPRGVHVPNRPPHRTVGAGRERPDMHAADWDRLVAERDRARGRPSPPNWPSSGGRRDTTAGRMPDWDALARKTHCTRHGRPHKACRGASSRRHRGREFTPRTARRGCRRTPGTIRDLRQDLGDMTNQRDVAETGTRMRWPGNFHALR